MRRKNRVKLGRLASSAAGRIIEQVFQFSVASVVHLFQIPVVVLLLWLPLFGFAAEEPLDVEEILSQNPETEDYVENQRCLQVRRIRSVTALDDRHIVFRVSRTERYLVQLPRRCSGIRRNDTIVYESANGMSICRHDSVRGTYGFGPGSRQLGPRCIITGFQRITPEQLELLRASLKQARSR